MSLEIFGVVTIVSILIVFSVCVLISHILSSNGAGILFRFLAIVLVSVCAIWLLIAGKFLSGDIDYKEEIKVELMSIPNGASVYLSSGYTSYTTSTDNIFVLTENTTVTDLEEFLGRTKKNVYFCVKDGTEVIFSYNFNLCSDKDAESILECYKGVIKDGGIITTTYRWYILDSLIYWDKEEVSNVCKQ